MSLRRMTLRSIASRGAESGTHLGTAAGEQVGVDGRAEQVLGPGLRHGSPDDRRLRRQALLLDQLQQSRLAWAEWVGSGDQLATEPCYIPSVLVSFWQHNLRADRVHACSYFRFKEKALMSSGFLPSATTSSPSLTMTISKLRVIPSRSVVPTEPVQSALTIYVPF